MSNYLPSLSVVTQAQAGLNAADTLSSFIQRKGYNSTTAIQSTANNLTALTSIAGAGANVTQTLSKVGQLAGLAGQISDIVNPLQSGGISVVNQLNQIGGAVYAEQQPISTYYSPSTPTFKTTKFNRFVSEVKNRGVAKQYNYLIEIVPPPFLTPDPTVADVIRLFCEQVMLPEISLSTVVIKDAGLNREAIYDKNYGQVSATFLCDQDMVIRDFFDSWATGVVQRKNGVFQYANRYVSHAIRIHQLNSEKRIVYTVTLNRVFVKIVNDMMLNASSRDASRFQVVFSYESWDHKRVKPEYDVYVENQVDVGARIIDDINQLGNIIDWGEPPVINNPDDLKEFWEQNPDFWI